MTLTEKAYASLRQDIVRGAFPPGSPLRLADLGERYGMGFSPLREALNRLQAERLVTAEPLRGFRVAPLSLEEFEDALQTRLMIETEALRAAMAKGGDDWESAIVSALYALKLKVDRQATGGDLWELEACHHAFHRALLEACGSAWLLEFFERLYAATERYRLPALTGGAGQRDIHAEHAALADAVLARDTALATDLMRHHYGRTAQTIRDKIDAPAAPSARVSPRRMVGLAP